MKNKHRIRLSAQLRQLGVLLAGGITPDMAMAIAKLDNPMLKADENAPMAGNGLVDAIPDIFPKTRSRLLEAAPERQHELLIAIADVLDTSEVARPSLRTMYFNIGMVALVCISMKIFVIPAFRTLFETIGADLPALTRLALTLTDWVLGPLGMLIAAVMILIWFWEKKPHLLGPLAGKIDAFARSWVSLGRGMQLQRTRRLASWLSVSGTGTNAMRSLECLAELLGAVALGRHVSDVAEKLKAGQSLPAAVTGNEWLPGLARFLAGRPDDDAALGNYARSLEANSDAAIHRLALLSQLIVGFIVGFLVIAMYLPIFKMGSAI